MKSTHTKGASTLVIVVIVVVLAVIAGMFYYFTNIKKIEIAPAETPDEQTFKPSPLETTSTPVLGTSSLTSSTPPVYSGQIIAGTLAPLIDFNKKDYETALKTNKLIVLYFYANWCPICKEETVNSLYPAFNELTNENVIGFRVNYKDNQTDSDETALAKQFGVGYQHTKVFVKNGERVLKAPDSWNKTRYLTEINKASAQ